MLHIKRVIPAIIISCLYFIVFNLLSFLLIENLTANFWCGYMFVALAWLCLVAVIIRSGDSKYGDKGLFLNAPSLLVSVCHLVIQTIISAIVMVFFTLNVKASMCFQVLICAIYIAIIISLEVYKKKNIT